VIGCDDDAGSMMTQLSTSDACLHQYAQDKHLPETSPSGMPSWARAASALTAVIVANDHDVLDLEGVHGILQARHAVHVLVRGQVADVALHKHLAGPQVQDLVGLRMGHRAASAASTLLSVKDICRSTAYEGAMHRLFVPKKHMC